ncbi:MAG: ATP-binding cassette domain-containing protein [Candidatus Promineifilaceae bacterium]|nr:ATP-binding cassette domain-containing protein [Candidatus Promineifilaceae bacterium]
MISVRGLTRRFGPMVAVDDRSLDVYGGEIFGFLGHNGAGMTTTVRLLNGALDADEGNVRVAGCSLPGEGPVLRRHTGVLTETPALEERLTGRRHPHRRVGDRPGDGRHVL